MEQPLPTTTIDGLEWRFTPIDFDDQFRVEAILARVLGPAVGASVGIAAAGLARGITSVLAEVVGDGEDFDLANLSEIDTADARLALGWSQLLESLGDTGGAAISVGLERLFSGFNDEDLITLSKLLVLGRADVIKDGTPMTISDMRTWSRVCSRKPRLKHQVLGAAFLATYGPRSEDE